MKTKNRKKTENHVAVYGGCTGVRLSIHKTEATQARRNGRSTQRSASKNETDATDGRSESSAEILTCHMPVGQRKVTQCHRVFDRYV